MITTGFIQVPTAVATPVVTSKVQNSQPAQVAASTSVEDNHPKKMVHAKNGFWRSFGALFLGGVIDSQLSLAGVLPLSKSITKLSQASSELESGCLSEAADYAIRESKADLKGASILRVYKNDPISFQDAEKLYDEAFSKKTSKSIKSFPELLKEAFHFGRKRATISAVEQGTISLPIFSKNTIIAPSEKFHLSSISDLGKLVNQNNKLGVALKYAKKAGAVALPAVILLSLCTRKKYEENGKKLNGWEKFTNGVKSNAPLLAFIAITPKLINNIWGASTGAKYTTAFLKEQNIVPDMLKKISTVKKQFIAISAITAASTVAATWAAVQIKDGLQARKDKQLQKMVADYS